MHACMYVCLKHILQYRKKDYVRLHIIAYMSVGKATIAIILTTPPYIGKEY